MTKEKLKQEAEKWLRKFLLCNDCKRKCHCIELNAYCEEQVLKAYIDSAEPREKRIAELEKENAELKADNDARKFAMAMSEKVEKQLREENSKLKEALEGYKKIAKWCDKCDKIAELKSENQKWKDEWQEQVQKATDEGYARTLQTIQLSKAKNLLAKWVEFFKPKGGNIPPTPIQVDTEQFLKDCEVEK